MTAHFLVERDGPIALLTFNRPDARNAMTFEMYEALHDACAALDTDPTVRAIVLRGAGDKAFASGTDIRQFLDFKTREDALGYEARLTRVLSKLAGMSKPTIAMLQGDAIGGRPLHRAGLRPAAGRPPRPLRRAGGSHPGQFPGAREPHLAGVRARSAPGGS
jgi:1,4-dihydroxy-2-naphthoyl-CoA synthase